jgi:hypothetical protein
MMEHTSSPIHSGIWLLFRRFPNSRKEHSTHHPRSIRGSAYCSGNYLFQGNDGAHIIPDPFGDLVIVQEIPQGNDGAHIIPDPFGDLVIVQEIPFFKGMLEHTSSPIHSGISQN